MIKKHPLDNPQHRDIFLWKSANQAERIREEEKKSSLNKQNVGALQGRRGRRAGTITIQYCVSYYIYEYTKKRSTEGSVLPPCSKPETKVKLHNMEGAEKNRKLGCSLLQEGNKMNMFLSFPHIRFYGAFDIHLERHNLRCNIVCMLLCNSEIAHEA